MIVLRHEDLDHLPLATRKTIDILGFVDAGDVDPLLYDRAYYATPDGPAAQRPYAPCSSKLSPAPDTSASPYSPSARANA